MTAPTPTPIDRLPVAAAGSVAVLCLAAPWVIPSTYTNLVARAAIYGIVALSMNVVIGYLGQVSLGHAAFVGLGAFGSGYALSDVGAPWPVALVVSVVLGGLFAAVLGAVALRVSGLYLALVTIAFGLFAQETLFNIRSLTGGGAGQFAPRPAFASSDRAYAYVCLAALAGCLVFDRRLTSTRLGRAIQALRDDERVAASWAIDVTRYKVAAFVVSGAVAGLAGALLASVEQLAAKDDFDLTLSITFLSMTVVGGVRSRPGVVQGGVLFAVLPTLLEQAHEHWAFFPFSFIEATWEPAIGALLLILTLVFSPGGIAEQQARALDRLRARAGPAGAPVP